MIVDSFTISAIVAIIATSAAVFFTVRSTKRR